MVFQGSDVGFSVVAGLVVYACIMFFSKKTLNPAGKYGLFLVAFSVAMGVSLATYIIISVTNAPSYTVALVTFSP